MAASRRSTRASTLKIAATRALSDGVYGREEGVSIEQRCRCWVKSGQTVVGLKPAVVRYYLNGDHSRYHRKPCERLLLCMPSRHYLRGRGHNEPRYQVRPFCVLAT